MDGYVFLPGSTMTETTGVLPDFAAFASGWDDLAPDPYLTGFPPYRFRRHARVLVDGATGDLRTLPAGAYLQSEEHNPLFGGVARTFAPIGWDGPTGRVLDALVRASVTGVLALTGDVEVNLHQIRILGGLGGAGTPAPEGPHRDGFDVISIHLIARDVDGGGETTLVDDATRARATMTLAEPLDSVYFDDRRFTHDTSAIEGRNRAVRRDVLLLSFQTARR